MRRLVGFVLWVWLLAAHAPIAAQARSHGSVALGTFTDISEPEFGGFFGAELFPERWAAWGLRLDTYFLDYTEGALIELSAARILGQSRPHLVIHAHFGLGYAHPAEMATLSAGIATQLGLKLGPLALGADGTLHLGWKDRAPGDGGPLDLFFTTVLALKAAW